MIKVVFRLAGAIFCGLILSLWVLQNNPHVQQVISEKIVSTLEKDWNVRIEAKKIHINLFTWSLYAANGLLSPTDGRDFSWSFEACKISVSPLALLFKKKLSLGIVFNHISAKTRVTPDKVDIVDHLYSMFQTNDDELKIRIHTIKINNLDCVCGYQGSIIKTSFIGAFCLSKKSSDNPDYSWDGYLNLAALRVVVNDQTIVDNAVGKMGLHYHRRKKTWSFETDYSVNARVINADAAYHIRGQWSADAQVLTLMNQADQTLLTVHGKGTSIHATGKVPVSLIEHVIALIKNRSDVVAMPSSAKGFCSIDLRGSFSHGNIELHGECEVEKGSIGPLSWQSINLVCKTPKPFVIAGYLTTRLSPKIALRSLFAFDYKQARGLVRFSNKTPIGLMQGSLRAAWLVDANQLKGTIRIDGKELKSDYSCHISDASSDEQIDVQGTGYFRDGILFATGKIVKQGDDSHAPGRFGLKGEFNESPLLKRFIYQKGGDRLIDIVASKDDPFQLKGKLKYSLVHAYFDPAVQRSIFGGNCVFDFVLNQKNFRQLAGSIRLASGRFYIPEGRNLITGFSTNFFGDLEQRSLVLNDTMVRFCKGALSSPQATITFDEKGALDTAHIPLCMDHLFVNWKRDFYGFVYGNFLLSKTSSLDRMNLTGNVVLERSLLRDTLLSQDSLGNVGGPVGLFNIGSYQLGIDVAMVTEKPIRVTTDALDTFANLDLRVEYEHNNDVLQFPRLTGAISLDGGHLKFLKNKLFIEQGKIQFLCNHMNDPLIDLVARNKINKYQIMLQVTGSMQKPTIILESSPELTEEQVFGLLLAGSEQTTLQAALPGVLMQQLQKILLGSRKYMLPGASIFEKITKPLQYVQIAPNFTDLSGRGGIKGTFSVDFNDQLHAQVEKNFNLQDDFSFYLQYMLSDDVSLRAVKDQRGEVGSELEVRLKL